MLAPNKSSTFHPRIRAAWRRRGDLPKCRLVDRTRRAGRHGALGRGLEVGLLDHQEEFEVNGATFLLPRDQSEHEVHVRWHPSNRHKKGAPGALFSSLLFTLHGQAAMALAKQRRHQRARSLPGQEGSWLRQQRSMGSPAETAQNASSPHPRTLMGAARPPVPGSAMRASWASLSMADHWPISGQGAGCN